MRVGIIGTGAIAWKHAQAYRNIGYDDYGLHRSERRKERGRKVCRGEWRGVCGEPPRSSAATANVDYADVCTFPAYRLAAVEFCARHGKHVLVQKPMAIDLETARKMILTARQAGHSIGRRQPASLRRFSSVFEAGFGSGTAGQNPAGGCVCEVVSLRRVLRTADQGKLLCRGRRRADRPGYSPSRCAARPDWRGR
jgi:hypothetical protein